MLKPTDILKLSEPVEKMYMDCASQLIINLCRHFSTGKGLSTAEWETQKLSEMGALTRESIEIIAENTKQAPVLIEEAIGKALGIELKDVEAMLSKAAQAGVIKGAATTWNASPAIRNIVSSLVNQAVEDSNIVNTVMLQSTANRYAWAVQNAAKDEKAMQEKMLIEKLQSAKNAETLASQLGKAQDLLNKAATSVATGAESRTTAIRRTIMELADEGITGFVDAGGHHWSPEAYINMDIRTTVHNAAIQGAKERSAEYGVTTFQISSHTGARPLCAPYQGKFYSWDGSSGILEDLHGNQYPYEGIQNTSYGEPAGIFGINCGHSPIPFVSGYNIPRYAPTEDKEENEKQYKLTQEQRQLEREIRQDKTKLISLQSADVINQAQFDKLSLSIAKKNREYKEFCKDNDLTPRNDRTQVVGYTRSISSKATQSARRQIS